VLTSRTLPATVRILLVLIVATTCWAAVVTAQPAGLANAFGQYQQLTWEERDGLPQNTVLAVAPTRDGYLWVGTYEGAARFDGVHFTLFTPSNTPGLGNSMVAALLEGHDGDLWLGTYGGGVSRMRGGHFTQYDMRNGLSSDFTTCLFEDRGGTLWIGTDGGGVSALRAGRFSVYTTGNGLPSNLVRSIIDDGEGGLLVGTSRGIARIVAGRVAAYPGPAEVVNADVRTLARPPDRSLWMAPLGGGLYRLDADGVTRFGPAAGLTNDRVESLLVGEDGRIWVGTSIAGVFRYGAGRFEHYGQADGLPGPRVPSIAYGADHDLWIGTDRGLVRFKTPRFKVYTQRDGLASDEGGSIFQDADGRVWAGTRRGLTSFINGAFTILTGKDGLPDGPLGVGSSAGRFLLLYSDLGLSRWGAGRFVRVPDGSGIPWNRATTVLEDHAGTLWVGVHDGGLFRVRDGQPTHLTVADGLADDSVLTLFEDRRGSLWVGTLRNGVTRISDAKMKSWSVRDGLAASHVKAFYEDASGTLWIGTHGGGLSRFKDGRFASISVGQGLYSDDIFQILEDDASNLWMNCNTGIWRTSIRQLNEVADGRRAAVESFAYGTADGMLSSEGVGAVLAGSKMRDGTLWFPTTKGIVTIDPRRVDTDPPRVTIEGAALDGRPVGIEEPIRMVPGDENLEIHYTGLSWSRPHAIKFRFQLAGLDRGWVDVGARRTAYYSHLPPGSYTFTVTADNGEGVWNATGTALRVVVLPRFYQTWWFRPAIGSVGLTVVWLSWRRRLVQLRLAQSAQQAFSRQLIESQERERQRIAAELHDSLGQHLLVVRNRALLGAQSQQDDEARRQFTEIGSTMAEALAEVRTISYNLRPHHLDQLGLTTAIRAMIETIGESSAIVISSDLDDVDGVFPPADEITIYRIIQESLNNVVKHSSAGTARVAVRCQEQQVEIVVHDDGQGFAPGATNGKSTDRRGFGLKGIAERVEMLGGTHTIDSGPGRGTTVTVRISLHRARPAPSHHA